MVSTIRISSILLLAYSAPLFGALSSSCVSGVEVFVINGIGVRDESDALDYATTLKLRLRAKIAGTPLETNPCIAVSYAHTRSSGKVADALEAISQLWFGVNPTDLDEHLVKYRQSAQEHLNKLILIGHSQGNLYATQAYSRLTTEAPIIAATDLKVLAVATPESSVAGTEPYTDRYTTSTVDFIADVLFFQVNPFRLKPNTPNSLCGSVFACHSFIDEYLNGDVSGPRILNQLVSAITALPLPSPSTSIWTQKSPANSPTARVSPAMAYDSARGQVVLFGGIGIEGIFQSLLNDTWVWDGLNWTKKNPPNSPPGRFWHAMAYDSARSQAVLFGGSLGGSLNDTWVWDGLNWTQKSPATNPPGRIYHAMAYDSARGQVVLFGGDGSLNDTWVWDGINWTKKNPPNSPPGRFWHAMAYDSARGQVVLFGGDGLGGSVLNDTWVWDGTNWTQKSPLNSPIGRFSHAMAYDTARSQVVLFGGFTAGVNALGPRNDTWAWDGINWTQKSPPNSPIGRYYHAMAYDSARGQVVLFGGLEPLARLNDTWVWP